MVRYGVPLEFACSGAGAAPQFALSPLLSQLGLLRAGERNSTLIQLHRVCADFDSAPSSPGSQDGKPTALSYQLVLQQARLEKQKQKTHSQQQNDPFLLIMEGYTSEIQDDRVQENMLVRSIPGRATQVHAASWPRHTRCLLYTSPSPRDRQKSRMPSSA